ncbi:GntR family transcriptional regulator [Hominifimenecus sp. rT4P-3]|uniref:GntR family transcriptional regulator n=1 Tax=Hominifimenecus sp. rT4P-3 TaxID=3242979 RepID=UPI003DA6BE4C
MAEVQKRRSKGETPVKIKKKSRMEIAYEELKQMIMSNRLKAGEMIGENYLTTVFQMSRTPIREAIRRLESEGLVEVKDGVGTFVTEISSEEIADAYEVRKSLEILAIKTAVFAFSEKEIQSLEARFSTLYQRVKNGDNITVDEYADADWMLHDLIIVKSKNRFVKTAMDAIGMNLKRYQYMSVKAFQNVEKCMEEHLEIIQGIREKDPEKVIQILNVHIEF